ncbi:hypothetical protein C8A01DRAFT_15091 [Parachaetomium inaequale]|uniref:Zn(2)-C6 fungal-type domain-containing protein n=1 Tax=Parachaetomium inaequale TaxID=2588326 RepID=A0AAN6ST66_9PEZI|nr:hypothetical protein C8A01DRAFT_15091 [Parachaetomium inaequale]
MRRAHRKSRYGCKVCKQRHIKCDERRPACSNCMVGQRQCSYLLHGPTLQSQSQSPSPGHLTTTSSTGPPTPVPFPLTPSPKPGPLLENSGATPRPSTEPCLLGEGYSLMHLELFHHFNHKLHLALPGVAPFLELALGEAFGTPYLMDELLALAAAHKSTLASNEHDASAYRTDATQLQTRALSRLNAAQPDVSDENCLALFFFSAFLGQHVLFDVFCPPRPDLSVVLDKFTHCLSLHRGIRTIAWRMLPWVSEQLQSTLKLAPEDLGMGTGSGAAGTPGSGGQVGTECAALLELLRTKTQLPGPASQACRDAVDTLQQMFDSARADTNRRFVVIQEWPVRVAASYVDLLDQRRPEALVILAYYGVLLLQARDYWAVGDAGSYLIRSVSKHLGTYWADWLKWPNTILENSGS